MRRQARYRERGEEIFSFKLIINIQNSKGQGKSNHKFYELYEPPTKSWCGVEESNRNERIPDYQDTRCLPAAGRENPDIRVPD